MELQYLQAWILHQANCQVANKSLSRQLFSYIIYHFITLRKSEMQKNSHPYSRYIDKECLGYMRGNINFDIQQVDMGKISNMKK